MLRPPIAKERVEPQQPHIRAFVDRAVTFTTCPECGGSRLDRLVDGGKPVIVIEHNQAVMAHADWIIDLGPGAGHDGGRIVFEGTPADLVAAKSTLTGEHLAAFVGGRPKAAPGGAREPLRARQRA
nr:hypothetical protein [Sorangium cellulosum]